MYKYIYIYNIFWINSKLSDIIERTILSTLAAFFDKPNDLL